MQKRAYIETTIPSFYYTQRTDVESVARMNWTRQWWEECGPLFDLVTSPAVIAELRRGVGDQVDERLALVRDMELVPITPEVHEIVDVYIEKLVMPSDPAGDALHLALSSFHGIGVPLTWNCRHLANPGKADHIRVVNHELGLPVPLVTTPLNYLSGGETDA